MIHQHQSRTVLTIARLLHVAIAVMAIAFAMPARAADLITATVTLTNLPAGLTTNITINGSVRYWTNAPAAVLSTHIQQTNTIALSATNLINHLSAYPASSAHYLSMSSPTNVIIRGAVGEALTVTVSPSPGWAAVTYSTQTVQSPTFAVRVPITTEAATNQTNIASLLVNALQYSTNAIGTNWAAGGNYLTKGASTQQVVIAPVQFNAALRASPVAFTNGFTSALTNINPVTSNLVNYGNAIRSEGPGGNSFQVGSNAQSIGLFSIAVGNGAIATNDYSVAIGTTARATNTGAMAIGNTTVAIGDYALAIGSQSVASNSSTVAVGYLANVRGLSAVGVGYGVQAWGTNSIAIGNSEDTQAADYANIAIGYNAAAGGAYGFAIGAFAQSTYSNSAAIGPRDHAGNAVATTATNQIRLGTANHHVSIPGQLLVSGTQSNTTFRGTNIAGGAWAYPRFDLTTLAAGNNLAVPVGTNRFVRAGAGPASAATIVGMIGGATSGGIDGQDVVVFNDTGYTLTFAVNSVDPVPANRINTPSASDVSIIDQGWASFIYDATDARWKLTGTYPTTATATNAVATGDGGATNLTVYGNAKPPLRIWPQTGSVSNSFELLTTNGALSTYIGTNGTLVASNMAVTPFASQVELPYRLFAITNLVLVTNVTAETSLISNLLGTATIPANWWTPGKSIQLSLKGRYFNGLTTTYTNWVRMGSTMIATNHSPIIASTAGDVWTHSVLITCLTTGAGGSFVCNGETVINNTAGSHILAYRRIYNAAVTSTIDTTTAQTLNFSIHPGNSNQGFHVQHGYALVIP